MKLPIISTVANPRDASPVAVGPKTSAGRGENVSDAPSADGVAISGASAALNGRAKVERLSATVQGGAYQVSSAATSEAIVRDALGLTA